MPDAIITSTESTFGTISGTFSADQSTITGTISGVITGTLTGTVGIPGPQGPAGPGSTWGGIAGTLSNQLDLQAALDLKAPLASPLFTGDPRGPTAPLGDSDTSLATTAFVQQELASGTAVAKNLEVYVRNQTGSTLAAGAIVYINGATGNRPTVTLAQANNDANSAQTFGFVKTAIANNGFGYVIVRGECENLDTSALTEGAQLYLSPTTPGAWTTTKPSAPQHLVYVGIVVRSHPTQGVILVAVQNGYELDELHDVSIVSKANNDLIAYDSATTLWKNKSIGTLGLATQVWVDAQGYLQAGALTGYALESWVTAGFYPLTGNPSGFLTSSSLTPYLAKADNLGSLTNFATARDNLGLGTLNTPVFAGVTAQGSGSNVANLTPTSLSLTHATSGSFVIQPSVGITFPDSTVQTTAFTGSVATTWGSITGTLSSQTDLQTALDGKYSTSNPSGYITSSALTGYATESFVTSQGYITSSALSPYLLSSTAASIYAPIASPTFTGLSTFNNPGNYAITIDNTAGYYTSISSGVYSLFNASTEVIRLSTSGIKYPDGVTQSVAYPGPSGFLLKADNLSGLASVSTARTNLGLGTMATETASNYLTTATAASTYAPLASPALTGNPTAPTPATADNDTSIATTAFVKAQGYLTSAPVTSVAGKTGAVTLVVGDVSGAAPLASPTFTGTPAAPTASAGTSTTQLATTAFVTTADNLKANLASPAFTGTPTAPTATAGTNTTQIATTAFVTAAVPTFATNTQARLGSSTTLAINANNLQAAVMGQDWMPVPRGNFTATTSGTGAAVLLGSIVSRYQLPSTGSSGHAYARTFGLSQIDQLFNIWGGNNAVNINFAKRIWLSGRAWFNIPDQANYVGRISFGKTEASGVGDLALAGIGLKYTGGSGNFVQLMVHNGTTLTTVNSSFDPSDVPFNWDIISDGAGNVTLFVNGSQVATTSAGPSGLASATQCLYQEELVLTGTSLNSYTRFYCARGAIYVQP